MKTDIWAELGGDTDRALRTDTREGQQVRVLVVERTFDTPPGEVWHALTTAERIGRWLAPVSGDLRLGGRFQLEGNAGGTVLRCEEPELLEVTWEYGDGVGWVVATLAQDSGETRFRLEHSAVVDEAMWDEFGPGAVGIGWEMALGALRINLAAANAPSGEPDYASPAYAEFVRDSAVAWAQADIAAGTDPQRANAASARCVAAYTAPPQQPAGDD